MTSAVVDLAAAGLPLTPARIVWHAEGMPADSGWIEYDGLCRMCAKRMTHGLIFDKWLGASFTDQNKVKCTSSGHICGPCVWAHSWVQPPGMEPPPEGKRGVCLRLYTHHWSEEDGYAYRNKANKDEIREWLRKPKKGLWFCCVADSGQKHVIPYVQMNPPGVRYGIIRFEERDVIVGDWSCLDAMTELLTDGVTKEAIEGSLRGPGYTSQHYMDSGMLIADFERRFADIRGGGLFDLCLWLAQRDEVEWKRRFDERRRVAAEAKKAEKLLRRDRDEHHGRRTAKARTRNGGADLGDQKSVSRGRSKRAQALGPAAGSCPNGSSNERKLSRVDDAGMQAPEPVGAEQLSLFGD